MVYVITAYMCAHVYAHAYAYTKQYSSVIEIIAHSLLKQCGLGRSIRCHHEGLVPESACSFGI